VRTLIDFADAPIFAIPVVDARTGGHGFREGMLIEGPQGWGEFGPPRDCDASEAVRWLTAATEVGTVGWPDPVRGRVAVSVTIPAVDAAAAHQMVSRASCKAADVAVGISDDSLSGDIARLEAVRDAIGPQGSIRCDAGGVWDVDGAISVIALLDKAAGGLEYVERPCGSIDDLTTVHRKVGVRIAATVPLKDAADVLILKCFPLGGVRRALRVAELCDMPAVVSSTTDTTIGLSAGLALAGALPELPFACGLGTRLLLAGDVVAGPRSLVPVDGYLPVAPMPPTPDPELVARYRMVAPGDIAWWRTRLGALIDPDPTSPRTP
jgi:O-succinylbenzoate synthase